MKLIKNFINITNAKTRVIPLIQIGGNSAVKTINFKIIRVSDVVSTMKFSKNGRRNDNLDIEASKAKKI